MVMQKKIKKNQKRGDIEDRERETLQLEMEKNKIRDQNKHL